MKRVLSFLMVFALLLSSFSNVTFAEEISSDETVEKLYAGTEEERIVTVNLRMGESVTYKQDGGITVDNPNLNGLDTNIVRGELVEGRRSNYPYSMGRLATALATYEGNAVELEDCLFTFTADGSANRYVISHTNEDNSVIYLSHNTNAIAAGYPCNTNRSVVTVGFGNDMFTLNNNNSYLYFWKNDTAKLHFDRQSGLDEASYYRTYFDLFTPSANASLDSEIKGYKKLTGLDQIVSGQSYLIAAKAANGKYYILNPVASGEKYNYVAQIITGQIGVQLASAENNFNAEIVKSSDCLFTFTATAEANKYVVSAQTANGTTVYLNQKLASSNIPTTGNSAVITVADSGSGIAGEFTLFDNSAPGDGRGGYLYFHKGGRCVYDRNGSYAANCSFELYEPSKNTPADSPIRGYAKVASLDEIRDGGQYLIVSAEKNQVPNNYYFTYPSVETSSWNHVAKLTNTMLIDDTTAKSVDTTITFTGVEEGYTSVTVNGITYQVTVKNEDKTIIIRTAESIFIPGTLQREVEEQNVISIKDETVGPYKAVQNVTEGIYLIGSSGHMILNTTAGSNPTGLAMQTADYTQGDYKNNVWIVKAKGNGYTIQDKDGKYINFTEQSGSQCSVVLGDTEQVLNIAKRAGGSFAISYGNHYINNFSRSNEKAAGWSGNDNDWYFYRVGIEITSIGEGAATLTINGVDYRIESGPTSAAELREDIAAAERTYTKDAYLTREWRAYETALNEAKEWAEKEATATQPQINAAREKLASAIAVLINKPVYQAPNTTQDAAGAPSGTTQGQPFARGTGGSTYFRIPAMITLSDGTIIAAADARWNHYMDACSIDIMVSKSTDNGKTWNYTLPAFFNDSTNAKHLYGACFIDPVLAKDANDKIYMMVDLYPAGIAINTAPVQPHTASGYVEIEGVKRLVLYTTSDPYIQKDTNYSYYVGDYVTEGENKFAPVYEVLGENEYSKTASFYLDPYFNLYTAEKEPMYCVQLADETKRVQQNVFFLNSILHVRCATYLYLITSEDKGETWSEPTLLNPQIRKDENLDKFYGVGPGAGLWFDDGTEQGIMMLPAYTHSNERASFIYSADGGTTWKRSQEATTTQSSESCLVQLDDKTVRHFYRSNEVHKIQYTDHTLVDGEWVAGEKITLDVARNAGNQVSAIRYSKTINGKPVIIFSTAADNRRINGKIYAFTVDMDATGKPMTLVATYDNDPATTTDKYAYSSIAELADGSIGLLYESNDAEITYKTIPMSEFAPELEFDISASEDGVRSEVAGYTLSLDGNIGVNFHMLLGEDVIADAQNGAYMNFALNGKDTLQVPVSDAKRDEETGYYIFKCTVPVKDMETEITAQIVLSNGKKGSEMIYTVREYIDNILKNDETYAGEMELVEAMSDFGNYAAVYFANGAVDEMPELPELSEEDLAYLESQKADISEDKDRIYYGSSLLLKSDTILRHYFTKEVAVEGYDVVKKGNLYYIESDGIPAHLLGEKLEAAVVADGAEITISYSPLSYAYITLNREGVDGNLANLMHAMYLYHQEAQEYRELTANK